MIRLRVSGLLEGEAPAGPGVSGSAGASPSSKPDRLSRTVY
jgi:hypothetical protein